MRFYRRHHRRDPNVADALLAEAHELERGADALSVRTTPQREVARTFDRAADAYEVASDALLEAGREEDGLHAGSEARRLRYWADQIRRAQFFVSKTYDTWDEEALEAGDTDDRGFEFEDEPMTLREVLKALDGMGAVEPSRTLTRSALVRGHVWFSTVDAETNHRTGDVTNHALHIRGSERAMGRLADVLLAKHPRWFR